MNLKSYISIVILFFLCSSLEAQKIYVFRDFKGNLKFTGEVAFVLDTTYKLNQYQIDKFSNFIISEKVIPDLGWGKFKGWIKINLKSEKGEALFLQIHNPVFDEINVYVFQDGKQFSAFENIRKGTSLRPNSFRLLTVPILLKKDSIYQIYISGVSKFNPVKFPIRFLDNEGLNQFRDSENLYNGLTLGFMCILIILNLLIYYFFRVRVFLVFSFSNISFMLLYLYLEGYLFGHKYSNFFFENSYFNFQYLIYYSFQIFNFYFLWSVYRLNFLNKSKWIMTYNILITFCLFLGFMMFLSPLWDSLVSHNGIVKIGLITRLGALMLNVFMLIIIFNTWNSKPFSKWMLLAILPGWLSYTVPRFAAVYMHDTWVTLPFLYSVSSIWNVLFISIGLFLELARNYKSKVDKEPNNIILVQEMPPPTEIHISKLSKRESEILQAFANGFSYQEISDAMFISPHTVRTHIKNIYNKLEINSKAEAVRWVIEHQ
jgi:DNA-binding CsgD family transcriptional regulator